MNVIKLITSLIKIAFSFKDNCTHVKRHVVQSILLLLLCGKIYQYAPLSRLTTTCFNGYTWSTRIINFLDTAFAQHPIFTRTLRVITYRLAATGQQVLKVNKNYSFIELIEYRILRTLLALEGLLNFQSLCTFYFFQSNIP